MITTLEQATQNAEKHAKKIAAAIKEPDDKSIHTFALLTALNAGATRLVEQQQIQLKDLDAPKNATYSNSDSNIVLVILDLIFKSPEKPVQQNEYSQKEREQLANEFREKILSPCFPNKKLPEPITSSDIDSRLAALEESKQFLDRIINEVSQTNNDSKKQLMNFVLSEGFDKVNLAIHYSFPQSSQALMSEEQLQRLRQLQKEIVAKQINCSDKSPLIKPSIDILTTQISHDRLSNQQIKDIQLSLADELGVRNLNNKNNPLSPAEYDRRVELLNNLTKNMLDGPEKAELEAANKTLREELGSKCDRYAAYLDARLPHYEDEKLISKIQTDIQEELSDPKKDKELTSDVESRDKLMKVMDARLDKMIESLENYSKENEKGFTPDDKKRLSDLKSLKETQETLRGNYAAKEQPQAGPQHKIG